MMLAPASQRAIVDAAAGASPEAVALATFDAAYQEHFAFVWRSARRLGVADAAVDDVVQEVFLTVHRRLADFEARASLRTWIFGILLRVVRDHRRALRRKSPHATGAQPPVDPEQLASTTAQCPQESATRAEAAKLVRQLLEALDEDKREVFVMAELEEMTAPEIAEILGVNVNTVYSRLRAARAQFEQATARHRAQQRRMP